MARLAMISTFIQPHVIGRPSSRLLPTHIHMLTDSADRQLIDRQTKGQIDKKTDRQAYRLTGRQTDKHIDGQACWQACCQAGRLAGFRQRDR